MKENKFVEYNAQLSSVEIAIRNIKSIGVDTTAFEERINKIKLKVNGSVYQIKDNAEISSADKSSKIDSIYYNTIIELNGFVEELSEYLLYFQVINKCLYVFNSQDINSYELPKIVDEIIDALKTIKTLHTIDDEKVINSLYNVVYTAIKAEYRKSGKSEILAYCKQDKIDSIFLTNCILRDIDELRNSNYDMNSIDTQMYKLNFSNSESMYLDEKFVWLIALAGNKESYVKDLVDSVTELKDALKANNSKLYPLIEEKRKTSLEYDNAKEALSIKKDRNTKAVAKSMIPLVITIASIGALVGVPKLLFGGSTYMTTTEVYTSDKGLKPDAKQYEFNLENYNGEDVSELTTLTIYEPWIEAGNQQYYERKILVAEIPNEDFEELSKIETITPNETEYRFTETNDIIGELSEDENNGSYFKVVRQTQDASNTKSAIASKNYDISTSIIGAYVIATVIYFCAMGICRSYGTTFGIIYSVKEIMDEIGYLTDTEQDKIKLKELLEKFWAINEKINNIISNSSETNRKYNDLMSKAENKEILKGYQLGVSLIENYQSELEEGRNLSLSNKKIV